LKCEASLRHSSIRALFQAHYCGRIKGIAPIMISGLPDGRGL